jgi:hypothetical protein
MELKLLEPELPKDPLKPQFQGKQAIKEFCTLTIEIFKCT